MLDKTDDISIAADNWLAQFEERARGSPTTALLKTLFHPDSYWRDVLALSWNIQTVNGADAILRELKAHAGRAAPRGFAIDPDRARAAPGDARRHQCDRGDLQIRDRAGPRQRHRAADPGRRRRQPAEGLDAADRARGIEGL